MGKHLLVVEDHEETRAALVALLEDAGYECTQARDGEAAIGAIARQRPDLVLLDLGLPGISGAELRALIRRDPRMRFLPIIFLSAHGERESKLAELQAGADDYITKPYDGEELLARVETALRRASGLRAMNPLSGLPGNATITEEIDARLSGASPFALLYVDIDRFKDFNDHYGFVRGDDMIRRLAEILTQVAALDGPRFLGHIGGDDFVLLTSLADAEPLAARIAAWFDEIAPSLYDTEDRVRGWVEARDRRGRLRRSSFASVSIGIVSVSPDRFDGAVAAARAAAEVKELAKRRSGSTWAVDRRKTADAATLVGGAVTH